MTRQLGLIAVLVAGALGCNRDREGSATVDTTAVTAIPPVTDTTVAPASDLDDATIVGIFVVANNLDIEAGTLALEKSQNFDVKSLAQQFVNDHGSVLKQGQDLALRLGVTPTPPGSGPMAERHAAAMADLRSKSGAEFDRAYAAHEVRYHQDVVNALKNDLLPAIQNAELKAFVITIVPAFEGHHQAAVSLQAKLGP